jgi:hypothetical protein
MRWRNCEWQVDTEILSGIPETLAQPPPLIMDRLLQDLDHEPSLTRGAEPLLRSRQLCSYSRIFQHFTEPEGLLSCSQEPFTNPYFEPDQTNPYISI